MEKWAELNCFFSSHFGFLHTVWWNPADRQNWAHSNRWVPASQIPPPAFCSHVDKRQSTLCVGFLAFTFNKLIPAMSLFSQKFKQILSKIMGIFIQRIKIPKGLCSWGPLEGRHSLRAANCACASVQNLSEPGFSALPTFPDGLWAHHLQQVRKSWIWLNI